MKVERLDAYRVQSESIPDGSYVVTLSTMPALDSCGCKDNIYRPGRACKHIKAARAEFYPRPVAPARVASPTRNTLLVDAFLEGLELGRRAAEED